MLAQDPPSAPFKPLFRKMDRESMKFAFDLWSHGDVAQGPAAILQRLEAGTMPCDGAWPKEKDEAFRRWTQTGTPEWRTLVASPLRTRHESSEGHDPHVLPGAYSTSRHRAARGRVLYARFQRLCLNVCGVAEAHGDLVLFELRA